MKIVSTSVWNIDFFKKFILIPNTLYKDHPYFTLENEDYYKALIESDFSQHNEWSAFMVEDKGEVLGRCFINFHKTHSDKFAALGYFEIKDNNSDVSNLLLDTCKDWGMKRKIPEIRGPIQISIFNSYKFKVKEEAIIIGDPIHQDFYPDLFTDYGFEVAGHWGALEFSKLGAFLQKLMVHLDFKISKGLTIREYDSNKKEEEIKTLHRLVMDSYSRMNSFVPCSVSEFRLWNEYVLDLISPGQFLFVDYKRETVGFFLNLFAPVIYPQKQEKRVLLSYVGKKRGLPKEVRGVINLLTKHTITDKRKEDFKMPPVITGVAENSPMRYWALKTGTKEICEYHLYKLRLI